MRLRLFSPILLLLIVVLALKIVTIVDEIDNNRTDENATTSVLIETAYAVDQSDTQPTTAEPMQQNKQNSNDSAVQNKSDVPKAMVNDSHRISAPVGSDTSLLPKENMSNSELKLLQELSQRRKELDKNKEELRVREQVLKATEGKIDQKMAELKSLQSKVEEVMKQYDQKELGKIASLVKIYENMKAREAAKIFDELEMPVLLRVVGNMKEVKAAPIIASMDPIKARDLSLELAKQKSIAEN